MFKLLVCLAVASSGCLIVPVEKTTVNDRGTVVTPTRNDANGTAEVAINASSATLTVTATRRHTCSRNVYRVEEVRTSKEADVDAPDFGGGGGGGGGPVAVFYLAVFAGAAATGIVSGTITAVDLVLSHDHVERRATLLRVEHRYCSTPLASREIDITLVSGAIVTGTTNATGTLTLEIPENEPDTGEVSVRIRSEAASAKVSYRRSSHIASL